MIYYFPPAHVEQLLDAMCSETWSKDRPYEALKLRLELLGYDESDPQLVQEAVRRCKRELRYERSTLSATGILQRLTELNLSYRTIGEWMGDIPTSTVAAMATGRIAERLDRHQRAGLKALIVHTATQLKEALDALG